MAFDIETVNRIAREYAADINREILSTGIELLQAGFLRASAYYSYSFVMVRVVRGKNFKLRPCVKHNVPQGFVYAILSFVPFKALILTNYCPAHVYYEIQLILYILSSKYFPFPIKNLLHYLSICCIIFRCKK